MIAAVAGRISSYPVRGAIHSRSLSLSGRHAAHSFPSRNTRFTAS